MTKTFIASQLLANSALLSLNLEDGAKSDRGTGKTTGAALALIAKAMNNPVAVHKVTVDEEGAAVVNTASRILNALQLRFFSIVESEDAKTVSVSYDPFATYLQSDAGDIYVKR